MAGTAKNRNPKKARVVAKRLGGSVFVFLVLGWTLMTFTGVKWPRWRSGSAIEGADVFAPGDFEHLYPKLVVSQNQDDRDKAARLLLFYGNLLLDERRKHSGAATIEDVKIVQILFKEHAQRHPALLTNYAFVLELLKRSMEIDDFATSSAVVATLRETHPQQLAETFSCLRPLTGGDLEFSARIAACDDAKQAMLLVLERTATISAKEGSVAANELYQKYRLAYPSLPAEPE